MEFDLLIRNGIVVDGTGRSGVRADVGVRQGRIAKLGKVDGTARREIDADGLVVAPGFIDPHTHYDAQISWDATCSPSPWHGVTTVVMGNCGVGIAPCMPDARVVAMQDLMNVEGMPYEALEKGVTWDWESFPEFMHAAARRKPAVNVGFLAPLTPFRYFVMGDDALERAATEPERRRIAALLAESMRAGALGFSTTTLNNHLGYKGRPLACRNADNAELSAYANVLRDLGKGTIEIALTQQSSILTDDEYDLLDLLLTQSRRPVTWLALLSRVDHPTACDDSLRKAEPLVERGGIPQIAARPLTRDMDLRFPHSFGSLNCWRQAFNRTVEEQTALYGSEAFRNQFREDMTKPSSFTGDWEQIMVSDVADPALKAAEGKTIGQIARERGVDGVDALLDFALSDKLRTEFSLAFLNTDVAATRRLLEDPRPLIGLSDGGAHVGVLCDAGYTTYFLGKWVRERQALGLEAAVARLTSQPADLFGIKDRGRLQEGLAADIAIFDPATVDSKDHGEKRYDLPGGGKRWVMPSQGVAFTIVNGEVVYESGETTDVPGPGVLIRP